MNYTQALYSCRKHCQIKRNANYFSFFLSVKKACYCLPIAMSPLITTKAVRKPLIHCSFFPAIQNGLNNSLNPSEINSDTVLKINIQRYCSESFIFDRNLYLCFKIVLLSPTVTYTSISPIETCSPVLIKTVEQWNHLLSFSSIARLPTYVWIDRNSTYLVDDLFKSKADLLTSNDLCLLINRTQTTVFDLIPCSAISLPGYGFCLQKPLETVSVLRSRNLN